MSTCNSSGSATWEEAAAPMLDRQPTFTDLFVKHRNAGTGRVPGPALSPRCWTPKEFQTAMLKVGSRISVDAIGNWLNGINTPRLPQFQSILEVFFGTASEDNRLHTSEREMIRELWTDEQRRGIKKITVAAEDTPATETAADWPRDNPIPFTGLAELELLTPQLDNFGSYRLRARLVFGAREDENTTPPVVLAAKDAFFSLSHNSNVVTDGSLIGVRTPNPNLKPSAGGIQIIGPLGNLATGSGTRVEYLDGEIFGDSHIAAAAITEENRADCEVTVTVSISRRGFIVLPIDPVSGTPISAIESEAKHAILNLLISDRLPKDELGRPIIQRAVIRRRAK